MSTFGECNLKMQLAIGGILSRIRNFNLKVISRDAHLLSDAFKKQNDRLSPLQSLQCGSMRGCEWENKKAASGDQWVALGLIEDLSDRDGVKWCICFCKLLQFLS